MRHFLHSLCSAVRRFVRRVCLAARFFTRLGYTWRRAWLTVSAACVAAAAYLGLHRLGLATEQHWTSQASVELWMVICGLNLVGGAVPWYTRVLRHQG